MKTRKLICAVVVAAGMLALAACSSGNKETKAPETTAPQTTAAPETEAPAAGGLKAGTYEGEAQGYAGKIKVTITIGDDGTITECDVDLSNESQLSAVGWTEEKAKEALVEEILSSGDGSIDAISSVSLIATGPGTLKALQACLEQAQ